MIEKKQSSKRVAKGEVSGTKNESDQLSDRPRKPTAVPLNEPSVPPELRERPQWVFWRYTWRKKKNDATGKWTKPPLNPRTNRNASTTNSGTWGTFEEAVAAMRRFNGDGVGFVFTEDDPNCGIDLDDVRDPETGRLSDEAAADIAKLDSYVEISPSGLGVHGIVKAKLPEGGKHPKGLGIFDRERYFCFTGARVPGSPVEINERQELVNELLARLLARKTAEHAAKAATKKPETPSENPEAAARTKPLEPVHTESAAGAGTGLTDDEIIARAGNAKNGDKFKALWAGKIDAYPSRSEADLALCRQLAFWCGRHPDRIDALFRRSGLFREEKWAVRTDYRERTINMALEGTTAFYDPHKNGATGFALTGWQRLYRLAEKGHDLRIKGARTESLLAALTSVNNVLCFPPLPSGMVARLVKFDPLDPNGFDDRTSEDDDIVYLNDQGENLKRDDGDQEGHGGGRPCSQPGDGQERGQRDAPCTDGQAENGSIESYVPLEAADDPHRLARLYLSQEGTHGDGPTLHFWRGEWHRWDGAAYRVVPEKELRAAVTRAVKKDFDLQNRVAQELAAVTTKKPPQARKVTGRLIVDGVGALASMTMLPGEIEIPAWLGGEGPFPATDYLVCGNGLVHLRSLVDSKPHFCPPTPRFFSPNTLGFHFDPNAPPPVTWLAFLKQLWPDSPQSIDTLQEWFGYLLLPDTSQHKILMLVGPKRGGKGTIARVLRALVSERNAVSPTLSSIATNFGLWPLIGKTLAVISDARLSGRTDLAAVTERILSITGEDPQTIDRKNLSPVTAMLRARFMILTNELPKLADSSGALASRMIILRLTESFLGREDPKLTNRLQKELHSILLWAIEGWRRLQAREHFIQPDSGKEMLVELENLASPVGEFVRECCQVGPEFQISRSSLFRLWMKWCEEHNQPHAGDRSTFGRDLRTVVPKLINRQHRDEHGKKNWYYEGIGSEGLL